MSLIRPQGRHLYKPAPNYTWDSLKYSAFPVKFSVIKQRHKPDLQAETRLVHYNWSWPHLLDIHMSEPVKFHTMCYMWKLTTKLSTSQYSSSLRAFIPRRTGRFLLRQQTAVEIKYRCVDTKQLGLAPSQTTTIALGDHCRHWLTYTDRSFIINQHDQPQQTEQFGTRLYQNRCLFRLIRQEKAILDIPAFVLFKPSGLQEGLLCNLEVDFLVATIYKKFCTWTNMFRTPIR